MACEVWRRIAVEERSAVGDERGVPAVTLVVVAGDDLGVSDDDVREMEGQSLAQGVPEPAGEAPLGPLALDAVHVERHLRAAQPR